MGFRIFIACLVLFYSKVVLAQNERPHASAPSSNQYTGAIEQARRILYPFATTQNIPGLSVAIGKGEEIVFAEGWGWADIENQIPVTPQTKFRIGSVSKLLTAVAAAKLHEQGRLDLDAPIQQYVPAFPEKSFPITARQLSGHLAGIRHYREGGFFNRKRYANVLESLEIFQNDSLLFRPGTSRSYSTYGYVLLSAVIEGASGQSFLSHMRNALFQPLNMTSTVAEHADSLIYHRASFYRRSRTGHLLNALPEDYSYKWAGGGFMSTAIDLVRFALGVVNGEFLRPETIELLFTPQRTLSDKKTREGIGWRPSRDWKGRLVAHHGGSSEGARAFLLLYPEERVAIAILANISGAPIFEGEAETIAEFFLSNSKLGSTQAQEKIAGHYSFSTVINKNPVSEHLYLSNSSSQYQGWLSHFYSENAPIVSATKIETTTRLTIASSRGLVNMWLKFDSRGFTGKWGFDKPKWDIQGKKILK